MQVTEYIEPGDAYTLAVAYHQYCSRLADPSIYRRSVDCVVWGGILIKYQEKTGVTLIDRQIIEDSMAIAQIIVDRKNNPTPITAIRGDDDQAWVDIGGNP